jgi:hypothetical protein
MPWWVSLYFTGYITFSLWAHMDDFRNGEAAPLAIFEMIGNMSLLLPALGYWCPQLYSLFGKAMIPVFVLGVLSMVVLAFRGIWKNRLDRELSLSENIGLSVFSTVLLISTTSPLIWWGGQAISSYL